MNDSSTMHPPAFPYDSVQGDSALLKAWRMGIRNPVIEAVSCCR